MNRSNSRRWFYHRRQQMTRHRARTRTHQWPCRRRQGYTWTRRGYWCTGLFPPPRGPRSGSSCCGAASFRSCCRCCSFGGPLQKGIKFRAFVLRFRAAFSFALLCLCVSALLCFLNNVDVIKDL
jgi:hypothetical protein